MFRMVMLFPSQAAAFPAFLLSGWLVDKYGWFRKTINFSLLLGVCLEWPPPASVTISITACCLRQLKLLLLGGRGVLLQRWFRWGSSRTSWPHRLTCSASTTGTSYSGWSPPPPPLPVDSRCRTTPPAHPAPTSPMLPPQQPAFAHSPPPTESTEPPSSFRVGFSFALFQPVALELAAEVTYPAAESISCATLYLNCQVRPTPAQGSAPAALATTPAAASWHHRRSRTALFPPLPPCTLPASILRPPPIAHSCLAAAAAAAAAAVTAVRDHLHVDLRQAGPGRCQSSAGRGQSRHAARQPRLRKSAPESFVRPHNPAV